MMLRNTKLFLSFASVVVVMGLVPAVSSAASFNYYVGGTLSSQALKSTVLTFNDATVQCNKVQGSGKAVNLAPVNRLDFTVAYSGCAGFAGLSVTVSPVEYTYDADGQLDLRNEVTIIGTWFGSEFCRVVIQPQSNLNSVAYSNTPSTIIEDSTVSGIAYTATGPFPNVCGGSSGTNGTLSGQNELMLNGGSDLLWWTK